MFESFSLPLLLLIFAASAVAVWLAGVKLSDTTSILSSRLGLGEALGGLILLAIATNLPELAITASAAWSGKLDLATGNILGGIAIQTVVLVVMDVFGVRGDKPLTYRAANLGLVLEAGLVIAILIVAIMAAQLPATLVFARVAPGGAGIALLWVIGIYLVGKARQGLPWRTQGDSPDDQNHPPDDEDAAQNKKDDDPTPPKKHGTWRAAFVFGTAALITLAAGVLLELSGNAIALQIGMSGVLFGSTVLAAATALPEVSTGLTSVKHGDYQLAVSDIFGGNAFLPVLFLVATLISGQAALPKAQSTDIYLAGLGVLLTVVYLYGLIFRSSKRILRMGVDSLVVLILYALGIAGLFAIAWQGGNH